MFKVFDDRTDEVLHTSEDVYECIQFISQQTELDYEDFQHLTIGEY